MHVDLKNLVSMTEANQNFSKVARLVDENGAAVILKNNTPRYIIIDYNEFEKEDFVEDENLDQVTRKYMKKYREAFTELAK